jgi:hypothetical protein
MKKLLIIGLLAGCAGSTPVESTTPTPEIVEAPQVEQANQYEGVLNFLEALLTLDAEEFAALCANEGGNFNVSANYFTCTEGLAGFSIQIVLGVTKGSSVLVEASNGEELAAALIEAAGDPSFAAGESAAWDLPGFTLIFGPVGNIAYIAVLERTGVAL